MGEPLGKVLCYGVLGVDQVVQIARLPERDGHTKVFGNEDYIGGEAANTGLTLASLGVDVKLMGNALGDDRRGAFFLHAIRQTPIDARRIDVDVGVRTGHAIVLSDAGGARSICGYFPDMRSKPLPPECLEDVALLSVDPFLGENAVRAARLARQAGVAVFAIELTPDHPLANHCDVVINSSGFMRRHHAGDPMEVAVALLKTGVETVVVTQGQKGCRVFQENGNSFEMPAFPVRVCDTTGAGDAFRAGLIYGYLSGWTLTHSVRFASGCAALTCGTPGGGRPLGSADQVLQFISQA